MRAGNVHGDLWEFGSADLVRVREHDGAEHRVFQLPNVAWPVIRGQQLHCGAADRGDPLSFLRRETSEEVANQLRDVLRPFAQWRHRDRKDMQAIEQILTETSGLHLRRK